MHMFEGILGRDKIKMTDARSLFLLCFEIRFLMTNLPAEEKIICLSDRQNAGQWNLPELLLLLRWWLYSDDAKVCSSMKKWRWRNSEASHIAENIILCFQKCSWSILYVTGKQPIDYNL